MLVAYCHAACCARKRGMALDGTEEALGSSLEGAKLVAQRSKEQYKRWGGRAGLGCRGA